jgi:hypothetical protein
VNLIHGLFFLPRGNDEMPRGRRDERNADDKPDHERGDGGFEKIEVEKIS